MNKNDSSILEFSESLKICQVCNVGFAVNKFLLPLIDAQINEGHDVMVVCQYDEYVEDLKKIGYKVETLPITRSMNPIKHLLSIWSLYWFMRNEKFDLVHVHSPVASLLGRVSAWLCRVPLIVYTAHGFYFHDDMPKFKRNFFIALEKIAGKMTDLLFTQSKEDENTAITEGIISQQAVFTIGNGVDIDRFSPEKKTINKIRKEFNIPENAFLVGMIGRQVEEKGILELLDAAISLAKKNNDIFLIIVGSRLTSDHAKSVDEAILRTKKILGDRLILSGMREDIPNLLSEMDIFVLPSWREGMPRTIIEAMMMRLPVVATDIRGSREEVIHGVTGLLVPVRNPIALANAIDLIYKDRGLSSSMGIEGRKKAIKEYDEKQVVRMQLDIVKNFWLKQGRSSRK
jgi:glycosyltransferase involved in cell wall biosynthesis